MAITDRALSANGCIARRGNWASHAVAAPLVVDADDETFESNVRDVSQRPVFWFDLGAVFTIMAVGMHQAGGNFNNSTAGKVWSSDDDSNWTERWSGQWPGWSFEQAFTPTAARYWMVESTAQQDMYWRPRTIHLFEDSYTGPQPPDGALANDLLQKVGTQYPLLWSTWSLIQGAPSNFDPITMLAIIGLWNNWLLNQILEGGTGGGTVECPNTDPNNQAIWDKIDALETQMDSRFDSASVLLMNYFAALMGDPPQSIPDVQSLVNDAWASLNTAISNAQAALMGAQGKDITDVYSALQSAITVLSTVSDNNAALIRGNPPTDLRSLLSTMMSSFTTQTGELQGYLGVDHSQLLNSLGSIQSDVDDIQATLALPLEASGALRLWPGNDGVTYGDPITVTGPVEVNALCHGVLVTVQQYPPGQSRMPAGNVTRYKGLGWLAFRSDLGDYDSLESIQFSDQVIITKQLSIASGCAVYCKPGARMTIRPFQLNP